LSSPHHEDLTPENFNALLDAMAAGKDPKPGPQIDRQFSAPQGGPTTLLDEALYSKKAAPVGESSGKRKK
jgi:NADH-quinone oxidoreductase subunit E